MRNVNLKLENSWWKCFLHTVYVCLVMDVRVCAAPTPVLTNQTSTTLMSSMTENLDPSAETYSVPEPFPLSIMASELNMDGSALHHYISNMTSHSFYTTPSPYRFHSIPSTSFPSPGQSKYNEQLSYRKCSDILSSWEDKTKLGETNTQEEQGSQPATLSSNTGCYFTSLGNSLTCLEASKGTEEVQNTEGTTFSISTDRYETQFTTSSSQKDEAVAPTSGFQDQSETTVEDTVSFSNSFSDRTDLFTEILHSTSLTSACLDCSNIYYLPTPVNQPLVTRTADFATSVIESTESAVHLLPSHASTTVISLILSGSAVLCETDKYLGTTPLTSQSSATVPRGASKGDDWRNLETSSTICTNIYEADSSDISESGPDVSDIMSSPSSTSLRPIAVTVSYTELDSVTTTDDSSAGEGEITIEQSNTSAAKNGLGITADSVVSHDTSAQFESHGTSESSVSENVASVVSDFTTETIRGNTDTTTDGGSADIIASTVTVLNKTLIGDGTAEEELSSTGTGPSSKSTDVLSSPGSQINSNTGSNGGWSTGLSVGESSSRGSDTVTTESTQNPATNYTHTPITRAKGLPQSVLIGLVFGLAFCVALMIMCVCFWKFCCNGPGITPHLYKYKPQTLRVAPATPQTTNKPKLIFVAD